MHPFLVNYTASQARFIESLATHMDRPQSDVVASIVVTVKEILAAEEEERREQLLKVMKKEPRIPGATYRQETLVLPGEEMAFVTELAREAGTSHSCAVRHIVAFFVENVEDGESGDDEEEEEADDENGQDRETGA
jgi:hypothetical protein